MNTWSFTNKFGTHYAVGTKSEAETYVDLLNEKIIKQYQNYHTELDHLIYKATQLNEKIGDFRNLSDIIKEHIFYNS